MKLRLLFLLTILGLVAYLALPRRAAAPVPGRPASAATGSGTTSTYSLYCGLWRVDNGFVSKIHIKNALIVGPLVVMPVLYMADGTQYEL
jgi:hypothetical protein